MVIYSKCCLGLNTMKYKNVLNNRYVKYYITEPNRFSETHLENEIERISDPKKDLVI